MPDAVEIFDQGAAHFQENEPALALKAFTKAIALEPGRALAYNGRAVVHALMGDMDRGIVDCIEAIRPDPEEPNFYRTRVEPTERGAGYRRRKNQEFDLKKRS